MARFNWPLWAGFLVSLFAFISYMAVFVNFPSTRDVPWLNLLLFVAALALAVIGIRRAFAPGRSRLRKIGASVLAGLTVVVFAFFVFTIFVSGRWLPKSQGAPHVGQKAPDFRLTTLNDNQVSLKDLLSQPINGKAPKGVLLVFYRGYW